MNKTIIKVGDNYMKYIIVLFRSMFFYILTTIFYRIMGKREIGELSIMDFIVSIFIAEMIAISIENYNKSIFLSLIPIILLVIIQISISYLSMKNNNIRHLIDGEPSVIINKGKINFKEMKKIRYNLDDLLMQLRINSIKSIEEVDYAVLESNGKLSIFKKNDDPNREYPMPLIIDGKLDIDVLNKIDKSRNWIEKEFKRNNIDIENVFYCFYKNNKLYIIENDKV